MRWLRCVRMPLLVAVAAGMCAAEASPQTMAEPGDAAPVVELVDINTATAAQLKSLPGMGEAYARRVIAGRPYWMKNQLVSRGILPQETYDKIQLKIIAKHPRK